ncbi:hypothetical protein SAMN04488128_102298 [Chitinophaga eiseniae]|uniref:Uncharacterized protein n=1 Tax=Chitinophaga eiseniae TaxID=634771 RepID=A0A1T4QCG7_9BACT|nr:hypothetical protein SAMN04488128_102298 [Chitinophaga eiseniae]
MKVTKKIPDCHQSGKYFIPGVRKILLSHYFKLHFGFVAFTEIQACFVST